MGIPVDTDTPPRWPGPCASFHHAVDRAAHSGLVPLLRAEIQDGDAQPLQIDARIVPRLRDGVFHEHRRHDEEPGGDRDLPAQ
jgi:hypothetical protein